MIGNSLRRRIRSYLARRLNVPEVPVALRRLANAGFRFRQIIDVGAHRGEFAKECLNVWPNSRVLCFEAHRAAVEHLREFSTSQPRISIVEALVGAASQERVALNVADTASSVLTEHVTTDLPVEHHDMVALDEIPELRDAESIGLLKIDVQGYELEVLRGAEQLLCRTQAILVELNLIDIHRDVPLMPEVVGWLHDRGFTPYDVAGLTRRPLDQALWQADLVFVPEDSPLRSDKRWQSS